LAWQLGGNLGHITPLLVLAKALRKRGHHITFALEDTRLAADVLTREAFPFVQAPTLRSTAPDLPREPASYPEMLFHFGFSEPAALTAAARAWRALYRNLAPDLILFDHAPTALLAARGTGIPRVVFGTGFASPPRVSPMPSIRPWQDVPLERLEAGEQRVLDTANAALRAIGTDPLAAFHELFDVEESILATLPELDHYGARPNARYWGPIFDNADGSEPHWPTGEGKKLFVYIRPNSAAFRPLAAKLRNTNLRTLWFAPGLSTDACVKLQRHSLRIVNNPLNIASVSRSADAAILHAGHGTTVALLLGGVPLLLLPEHVEQLLLARHVTMLGAGSTLNPRAPMPTDTVDRFVGEASFSARAQAFASKYKKLDQSKQQADVLTRIEALMASTAAAPPTQSTVFTAPTTVCDMRT
jgi:UDP:flavonoid glycosyltransferase YjiC (YdhE family)